MTLGGPIKFNEKGQVEGIGSACVQNLNLRADRRAAGERGDSEARLPGAGLQESLIRRPLQLVARQRRRLRAC